MTTWRVLVPRRFDQRLAEAVEEAGGLAEEVDLIHRHPVAGSDLAPVHAAAAAGRFDWLAVTSAYTLEALAELGYPIASWLPGGSTVALGASAVQGDPGAHEIHPGTRLAAVGPATAARLAAAGLRVDLVPIEAAGGQALADLWPPGPGQVVIPGADRATDTLPDGLRRRGWEVTQVGVYRTSPATRLPADLTARWRAGAFAAYIATSGSTARAAATLLGPTVPVVAIGQPSALAARRAGFEHVRVAASPAPADILTAVLEWVARPGRPTGPRTAT
jgi:uroporphyrinogen-III synthase